jgi:uncharacterized protein
VGNDLNTPLGQDRKPPRDRLRRPRRANLAAAALVVAILAAAGYTATRTDPLARPDPDIEIARTDDTALPSNGTDPSPDAAPRSPPRPDRAVQAQGAGIAIEETLTGDGLTVTTFRPSGPGLDGPRIIESGIGQDLRVAHIPEPGLLEESAFGPLPAKGGNGERAMDAYARSWSGARGTRIAIVVGGLGLSQTGTQHAIRTLPEEVTLAFAPRGNSLQRWMQDARRSGHEILLQVPMEPFGAGGETDDDALTVGAGEAVNRENLHRTLARITNYTGVMNHLGGRFMADVEALEPVIREIEARGLLFLDDGTSAQSRADMLARTVGTPFAAADIVLDTVRERGAIMAQLDALERVAVRNGQAIGVASAFEVSVDAIATWLEAAMARNIEIVGVSALVDDPRSR